MVLQVHSKNIRSKSIATVPPRVFRGIGIIDALELAVYAINIIYTLQLIPKFNTLEISMQIVAIFGMQDFCTCVIRRIGVCSN
ncbi:hypothetical protein D3C85_1555870 [compost metagenome]